MTSTKIYEKIQELRNEHGNDIIVKVHYFNDRTPGGYWGTKKRNTEIEVVTDEYYKKFVSPGNLWRDDRITREYTRLGYLPTTIKNTSPDNNTRTVYEFYVY